MRKTEQRREHQHQSYSFYSSDSDLNGGSLISSSSGLTGGSLISTSIPELQSLWSSGTATSQGVSSWLSEVGNVTPLDQEEINNKSFHNSRVEKNEGRRGSPASTALSGRETGNGVPRRQECVSGGKGRVCRERIVCTTCTVQACSSSSGSVTELNDDCRSDSECFKRLVGFRSALRQHHINANGNPQRNLSRHLSRYGGSRGEPECRQNKVGNYPFAKGLEQNQADKPLKSHQNKTVSKQPIEKYGCENTINKNQSRSSNNELVSISSRDSHLNRFVHKEFNRNPKTFPRNVDANIPIERVKKIKNRTNSPDPDHKADVNQHPRNDKRLYNQSYGVVSRLPKKRDAGVDVYISDYDYNTRMIHTDVRINTKREDHDKSKFYTNQDVVSRPSPINTYNQSTQTDNKHDDDTSSNLNDQKMISCGRSSRKSGNSVSSIFSIFSRSKSQTPKPAKDTQSTNNPSRSAHSKEKKNSPSKPLRFFSSRSSLKDKTIETAGVNENANRSTVQNPENTVLENHTLSDSQVPMESVRDKASTSNKKQEITPLGKNQGKHNALGNKQTPSLINNYSDSLYRTSGKSMYKDRDIDSKSNYTTVRKQPEHGPEQEKYKEIINEYKRPPAGGQQNMGEKEHDVVRPYVSSRAPNNKLKKNAPVYDIVEKSDKRRLRDKNTEEHIAKKTATQQEIHSNLSSTNTKRERKTERVWPSRIYKRGDKLRMPKDSGNVSSQSKSYALQRSDSGTKYSGKYFSRRQLRRENSLGKMLKNQRYDPVRDYSPYLTRGYNTTATETDDKTKYIGRTNERLDNNIIITHSKQMERNADKAGGNVTSAKNSENAKSEKTLREPSDHTIGKNNSKRTGLMGKLKSLFSSKNKKKAPNTKEPATDKSGNKSTENREPTKNNKSKQIKENNNLSNNNGNLKNQPKSTKSVELRKNDNVNQLNSNQFKSSKSNVDLAKLANDQTSTSNKKGLLVQRNNEATKETSTSSQRKNRTKLPAAASKVKTMNKKDDNSVKTLCALTMSSGTQSKNKRDFTIFRITAQRL